MAETYVIKMPQLSDTMTEGVVVSWEKQPGDRVQRGDIVAQVETDKAIMDVEVFREGYLSGPLAPVDSTVAVGEPIAYVVADAAQVQTDGSPPGADAPAAAAQPGPQRETVTEESAEATEFPEDADGDEVPEGAYMIKMPQLSDTMTEGVLVSWEKEIGTRVERGDVVAQVETDKAVMDVEVFREGYLSGPLAEVDAVVPVGAPIAYLVAKSEDAVRASRVAAPTVKAAEAKVTSLPAAAAQPKPRPDSRVSARPATTAASARGIIPAPRPHSGLATPYARKLAAQYQVDLNAVEGTGTDGAIQSTDVLRARSQQLAATPRAAMEGLGGEPIEVPGVGRTMTSMERAISRSMTGSLQMPTFHVSVNARHDAMVAAAKQAQVSVTVAIAKACALAIQQHPSMNWAYQPVDKLVEREEVDIGMAVATEGGGLIVPVLRQCETRSLSDLNTQWKDLVERARKKRLTPDEYANPTFTVSNMGMLGVSYFDAIPTPGTAAILAIASAGPDGLPLTITADHRVVNGASVAMFLNTLKGLIEQPGNWLGEPQAAIPEGDWDYEVVVIGGGPGGEDCARELAGQGIRVAMVNDGPLPGGECLWRGCIPSKTWRAAADRLRDRMHDAHLGVEGTTKARLNWDALQATRREVLETRGRMAQKTDTGVKIKLIHGFARFEGPHQLFVDTTGNVEDPYHRGKPAGGKQGQALTFGCAVVATGAPPFVPPIPGALEALKAGGVLTSDTVWSLGSVPKKLGIIGGGAIGLEMAQIFQDFGSQVVLVEAQARLLAEADEEVAAQLAGLLAEEPRLKIHTSAKVTQIKGKPGAMKLVFEDSNGKAHTHGCDYVLMATGKRPDIGPLQLDKVGVAAAGAAIGVDGQCRTNVPHVFAVGDVIGGLMLAHTAAQQGRVAAAAILGEGLRYDADKDCGVVFTRPQVAFVGLTLAQAKARKLDAVEVKVPLSIDAKAMITNETQGLIKLVVDKGKNTVIGAHFLADHADTLIGEAVMLVSAGITLEQLAHAIHPHPTQTELFGDLARRLLSRLRRGAQRAKQAG